MQKLTDFMENVWEPIWEILSRVVTTTFPILNMLIVIAGGCLGLWLQKQTKPHLRETLGQAAGLVAVLSGVTLLWNRLFFMQEGRPEADGTVLVLFSLLVGTLLGAILNLDAVFNALGRLLQKLFESQPEDTAASAKSAKAPKKSGSSDKPPLLETSAPKARAEGFLAATAVCAFGGMSVNAVFAGMMQDNAAYLFLKLGLDLLIICALAVCFGSDVIYASVTVLAAEGVLTLLLHFKVEWFTPDLQQRLVLIGCVIAVAAGGALCLGKRLRALHMIPAFLIPGLYELIVKAVEKLIEE